ncbi:extracellular solute-binding protein [Actinoallomurus sp. CA-150999]|uniref:extracellular solute-binding protein n=1 Tax=Actinoallomurus sp. CA-150999 TaxID=3239887 RepID=UPI003D8CA97E
MKMELTRRRLLQAGLLTGAGLAASACGSGSGTGSASLAGKKMAVWVWDGCISPNVLKQAVAHFTQTKVTPSVIGGDFKQKLVTTMTSRAFLPSITGVKGEDIASFKGNYADQFVDLNTLGAGKVTSQYVGWKLKQATTKDGKLLGLPIDIGPCALFYRHDVFAKAGLPTEPGEVYAAASTWDDYFALGVKLKKADPKAFMIDDGTSPFTYTVQQGTKRFIDENNHFIGDQDHIRTAWDRSIKALQLGIVQPFADPGSTDSNAAYNNGTVASSVGAAWHYLDLVQAAPKTSGKWRVATMPGGPANFGGSFLAIPAQGGDHKLAFEVITWLLNPQNEAQTWVDNGNFPANTGSYTLPTMTAPVPFFGGQKAIEIFAPAAQKIQAQYEAPADAAVSDPFQSELKNVWAKHKDPEKAWSDAVSTAKQVAQREGVN